jgi:hypothetical protein
MAVLDRIRLTGLLVIHGPGLPKRKAGAFNFRVDFPTLFPVLLAVDVAPELLQRHVSGF